MTKNLDNEGLSSIADNYQLFYVDLWGVVHNGVTLHLDAIKALKEIPKGSKVEIYTDSKYVKSGITEWIHNWKKNGWKTSN